MPYSARPRPVVLGTDPTAISAWEPSTTRPSDSVTATPSAERRTEAARELLRIVMPRARNTRSIAIAASWSSCGITRSRLDTSVTATPIARYAEANSAPVTPDPTTTRCEGSSGRSYTWRQSRIRSPSGTASGSTRGVPPVATSTADASIVNGFPSAGVTSTRWVWPRESAPRAARPGTQVTPALTSLVWMSADWARASFLTRPWTAGASRLTAPPCTPNSSVSRYPVTTSETAMKVLDGTQSDSTQAPPAPASSTTVTSASSWAATRAASYPAGPPPMITTWPTYAPKCPTRSVVFSLTAAEDYRHRRASLRRVRLQSRPGPHACLLPVLPDVRHGVAGGLAADLRRGGRTGLGGRGLHDRRVAGRPGVRRGVRRPPARRRTARRGRGRHRRHVPEAAPAGGHAGRRRDGVGVRVQRVRGLAAG